MSSGGSARRAKRGSRLGAGAGGLGAWGPLGLGWGWGPGTGASAASQFTFRRHNIRDYHACPGRAGRRAWLSGRRAGLGRRPASAGPSGRSASWPGWDRAWAGLAGPTGPAGPGHSSPGTGHRAGFRRAPLGPGSGSGPGSPGTGPGPGRSGPTVPARPGFTRAGPGRLGQVPFRAAWARRPGIGCLGVWPGGLPGGIQPAWTAGPGHSPGRRAGLAAAGPGRAGLLPGRAGPGAGHWQASWPGQAAFAFIRPLFGVLAARPFGLALAAVSWPGQFLGLLPHLLMDYLPGSGLLLLLPFQAV